MKLNFSENHKLLFSVVFFGFVALSILIAIIPAIEVNSNDPMCGVNTLTPAQFRGLKIYVSEGCLYCHTQQVRPLPLDKVFGRPSSPFDYSYLTPLDQIRMTPAVLGSERTGPDLSNIGNRQPSEIWHHIHLYNPRAVVKSSIMQAYPWLYEIKENPDSNDLVIPVPAEYAPKNGKVVATQKAKDLVAYLLFLKQKPIEGISQVEESSSKNLTAANRGAQLYNTNCASCHQQNGEGIPMTFPPLKNSATVNSENIDKHIRTVLFGLKGEAINGIVYPSEMPAQKDNLTDEQIADIINYERSSWGNNGKKITADDVKKIRAEGK
ncbi:cbb3-type cytochrome c oxidase subunit II [Melioribacteraceae bacterium 4301-Me]|uniref:cbb3-type cytochrome c oxidase subunit II n=1 Tax=Pyranulibacter aquaticus TaxID=3163344 RepID=UPI00359A7C55